MAKGSSTEPGRPDWMQLSGINLRRVGLVAIIIGVLAVIGWLSRPAIIRWQHAGLLVKAREFQSKKDVRSAVLVLKGILAADINNLEATRLIAELAESSGAQAAVPWRARLSEMEPSDANLIALANVSMRFKETTRARVALGKVSPAGQKLLPYKKTLLSLLINQNQRTTAELVMRDILKMEPPSPTNMLSLAMIQVSLPATNSLGEAVKTLEVLRTNPAVRLGALRGLCLAWQRLNRTNQLLTVAAEMAADPAANINDKLQFLDVLRQVKARDYAGNLTALQKATTRPDEILAVESWMSARGLARLAESWIESLPSELRRQHPVPMALAESLVIQENWSILEELTRKVPWPQHDFLRLAMHSRALRARDDHVQSRKAWQAAVEKAGGRQFDLKLLARAAQSWHWEAESEEVWWALANGPDEPRAALDSLQRVYTARGSTRQLLRVYRRALEIAPDDLVAKNNVAMYQLLLFEDVPAATQLAKGNYEAVPGNPYLASTYALALLLNKRVAEARSVMSKLPEKALQEPAIAAYYGVILAEAGDKTQAARYLDLASKAQGLVPEEIELVKQARKKLQ